MMKKKRIGAILLSVALAVTQLPAVAMAKNIVPEDGSIASFMKLDSGVAKQTVPVGTAYEELVLPDKVEAKVYHVTEDMVIPDKVNGGEADREGALGHEDEFEEETGGASTASPSDADRSASGNGAGHETDSGETVTTVTTEMEEIPVTWESAPAYNGDAAGSYVFTADADGYALTGGAKLPQITVTVTDETVEKPAENPLKEPLPCAKTEGCTLEDGHEGECVMAPPENNALVKTVTGWTFADSGNLNGGELSLPGVNADNQADFDAVVFMLPVQIIAEIEGETDPEPVDITWSCPEYRRDADGNWPFNGEYTFTAELEAGYACEPLPTVKVLLGGADYLADYGGLVITGDVVMQETDGQIKLGSGTYKISGEWAGTLTANLSAVITVPSGVTANVTLNDVTVDVSTTDSACAFAVETGGTANITLVGDNILTSGSGRAGLESPETAEVMITGGDADSLTANGGESGAGIGGGSSESGGTIKINGGTVTANGGGLDSGLGANISGGSGIGGGGSGDAGGTIKINGGTVTASGGSGGSGIGGGGGGTGSGGTIKISGGTVTANGCGGGAGIGGGIGCGSGDITIDGSANVTAVGGDIYGVIASGSDNNGTIRIGGNAVVNATGAKRGAGIGGGGGSGSINGGAGIGGGAGKTDNNRVEITGGMVTANGIGGGAGIGGGIQGDGGVVVISGADTVVNATGSSGSYDVGSGYIGSAGSLSVTGGATLEMTNTGTDVANPEYKNCTIINKDGESIKYDDEGKTLPTLLLSVAPASSLALPGELTLTATLSGAVSGNSERIIIVTVNGTNNRYITDSSGVAVYTMTNPPQGTYRFGATFEGDGQNNSVTATEITGYTVNLGIQSGFDIIDPGVKTYGDSDFSLRATGGQSTGGTSFSVPSGNGVLNVEANGSVKIIGAGTVTVTATKDGDSTYKQATATREITVARRDIAHVTVNVTGGRVYTGSQLQPVFEVKDGSLAITTGDYTCSYGPNVNAGTGTGSITFAGQQNYTGTKTIRFDIEKHPLSSAVITLESSSYPHTGGEIKPAVTKVEVDGITVLPTEYDVGYANNINEGTATATITAKADGNFMGSASTTYTITGNNHSSGSSGGSGSDGSSSSTGDRTYDAKKGWVSARTGIITGTGSGYSKWLQDENGWKLQYADGTMAAGVSVAADDGRTYERLTWELINGAWYAFGADGYAESGLIFDPDLGGTFYIDINTGMKTGWQMIDGKWYYFNPISDGKRGIMFTDTWIDGWYVDKDGIWNGEAKKD
ncbi:hypothetical protein F220043C3_23980 [Enterocloster asparagiformis]|uniref:hypothetical protein n=1 Tax=Enterocloster asparagiformis TaxID=333367 RepID=UPI0034BCA3B4